MRFLLINVPIREDSAPNNFPIGLGMIAAVLEEAGHGVEVLDINAHRYAFEEAVSRAAASDADAVGISGLVSTYAYQSRLIAALKSLNPNRTIIAGGGCATSISELMLTHTAVDVAVIGEGEQTVVELAHVLESGGRFDDVKGLAFRRDDGIHRTDPREPEPDLDRFPLPAYHLFPVEIYMKSKIWRFKSPAMSVISSRGCPMSCNFCYNLFGRRSYRRRGVDSILAEIRLLKREYGIRTFAFVDDNVTINRNHLRSLCSALAKENVEWGCHGRVDTADDERLSMMADAGCKWLGFGVESGSQRILDAMHKQTTVEKAEAAVRRTQAHGIFANTTFIYGYPGEDMDSIRETLRFKLNLGIVADGFFATPYPGTELYKDALEKGVIADENSYALSLNNAYDFRVNLTEFKDEKLLEVKAEAHRELKLLTVFRNCEIPLTEAEPYLELANRILESEPLLPEAKSLVLFRLAAYYDGIGQHEMAFTCRGTAYRFGGRPEMLSPLSEAPRSACANQ